MADTARSRLPMLEAGQAPKEMTVNEALARLDLLVQTGVVAVGIDTPPATPAEGQAWIVGGAPTGAWTAQPRALAGWEGRGVAIRRALQGHDGVDRDRWLHRDVRRRAMAGGTADR